MNIFLSEMTFAYFTCVFMLAVIIVLVNYFSDSNLVDGLLVSFITLLFIYLVIERKGFGVDEEFYLLKYNYFFYDEFNWGFSFYLLYYLLHSLGIDELQFNNSIVLLYLLFSIIFVYTTVKDNNKAVVLMFSLFTYVAIDFEFNVYRQGFAVIFFMLFMANYSASSKLASLFWAVLMIGFHWTSVFLLVIYLLSQKIRIKDSLYKRTLDLLTALFIISCLFKLGLMGYLLELISSLPFDSKLVNASSYYKDISRYSELTIHNMSIYGKLPFMVLVITYFLMCRQCFRPSFMVITVLAFSVIMIDMPYSFRNFYWVLGLLPYQVCVFMNDNRFNSRADTYNLVGAYFLFVQMPILTTSGIIPLIIG